MYYAFDGENYMGKFEIDGEMYTTYLPEERINKQFGCYGLLDEEGRKMFAQTLILIAYELRLGVGAPKLH